jgi:hypothetical protein
MKVIHADTQVLLESLKILFDSNWEDKERFIAIVMNQYPNLEFKVTEKSFFFRDPNEKGTFRGFDLK